MKIKVVEISSGFANIPNGFVLADTYFNGRGCQSNTSGYDTIYTIDLPDGFSVSESCGGSLEIYHGEKHVELAGIDEQKRHITGVSIDGFHSFDVVAE